MEKIESGENDVKNAPQNEVVIDNPKNFEGMIMPQFRPIHTGQTIMMFQTPQEYVDRMNTIYDEGMKEKKFPLASAYLVGKIKDEYSLYRNDNNVPPQENYNFLPDDIHEWIKDRIHQYIQVLGFPYAGIKTSTAWVNDYKAGEYNPNHIHVGSPRGGHLLPAFDQKPHLEGLIGLMTLKVPEDMGKEITNESFSPMMLNGYTEFITGRISVLFAQPQTLVRLNIGDFVVFPYDMWHCVYPHFNENNETRRTMPTNIDVYK
jgi:hypothetical protein